MRQFIFTGKTEKNGSIFVSGKDYRYLMNVLRLKINDKIDVRLKNGDLLFMEIISADGKTATLKPIPRENSAVTQGVSAFSLGQENGTKEKEYWLFQFMPKPQKMDLIIRQATECGVSKIVPILSEYSVKQEGKGRLERWERIIKEALQQSGSPIPTKILEPCTVEEAANLWKDATSTLETLDKKAFILHEDASLAVDVKTLLKDTQEANKNERAEKQKKLALGVGCEGGFSKKEFETLKEVGFMPLHFNTNVLRAETAAIYGMAILQQIF